MSDKRLVRTSHDKMIAGVCGGLAAYFNIDPALVRLAFVLFTLIDGLGLLIYLVLALLMPAGEPVAKANGFDAEEIVVQDAA